jgi:tetratricopeptide (TPR) repeat protein
MSETNERGVMSNELHAEISRLCNEGDALVNDGADYVGALKKYHKALKLIPEPKEDWEAATLVLSAIGDAHYFAKDYPNAISAFRNAVRCPEGLGNPYIHLRLGECHFELGEMPRAEDELARAYMGADLKIFKDEDPKYWNHMKTVLDPPSPNSEWTPRPE